VDSALHLLFVNLPIFSGTPVLIDAATCVTSLMRRMAQSNLPEAAIFTSLTLPMKYLLLVALIALFASSCNRKAAHSDSFVNAKVDSIVGTRMEDINTKAMEDLDQRMTIEVKAKADSIIAARRGDTLTAAQQRP
jgi:hypothetical protein